MKEREEKKKRKLARRKQHCPRDSGGATGSFDVTVMAQRQAPADGTAINASQASLRGELRVVSLTAVASAGTEKAVAMKSIMIQVEWHGIMESTRFCAPCLWYLAVTCSLSVSPEEYRNVGLFEIDANRIWYVFAEDKSTGKSNQITITNEKVCLSHDTV